jgi:hypothetical protein
MGATGYRFSAVRLALGAAACVAIACGGAASTPLDRPLPTQPADDGATSGMPEASASSSGGGGSDATLADDSSSGGGTTVDAADDAPAADAESTPVEAGPPDSGSTCGVCTLGNRCCMVPGTISFGQCYSVLCMACCL